MCQHKGEKTTICVDWGGICAFQARPQLDQFKLMMKLSTEKLSGLAGSLHTPSPESEIILLAQYFCKIIFASIHLNEDSPWALAQCYSNPIIMDLILIVINCLITIVLPVSRPVFLYVALCNMVLFNQNTLLACSDGLFTEEFKKWKQAKRIMCLLHYSLQNCRVNHRWLLIF